jgi:hypothetical protein
MRQPGSGLGLDVLRRDSPIIRESRVRQELAYVCVTSHEPGFEYGIPVDRVAVAQLCEFWKGVTDEMRIEEE